MSKTTWAVDGPDDTIVELKGRSFALNDDGAPMLWNLLCQDRGRHVHVDYCRAGGSCDDPEIEHIPIRLTPKPDIPKDWVSHFHLNSLAKDPYSRDDQLNFAKCDSFCPGSPEHARSQPPQPSYCTLPIFHPPSDIINIGQRYVSNDGHVFSCENPAEMHTMYETASLIIRSSPMTLEDRRPLPDTPWTARIAAHANNRLGAVHSALNAFWESRRAMLNPGHQRGAHVPRHANTVILFDRKAEICVANDAISTPNELTSELLRYGPGRGTNFTAALSVAEAAMQEYWDVDRYVINSGPVRSLKSADPPILIFLSDGECNVPDLSIQSLAHVPAYQKPAR
ncbi:hypothetical protein B0H11DRAFT_1702826 [Mycena galericulata]|nr:hypothetical protein B0H11DRAFT_1702826 [Mycena galericulata]